MVQGLKCLLYYFCVLSSNPEYCLDSNFFIIPRSNRVMGDLLEKKFGILLSNVGESRDGAWVIYFDMLARSDYINISRYRTMINLVERAPIKNEFRANDDDGCGRTPGRARIRPRRRPSSRAHHIYERAAILQIRFDFTVENFPFQPPKNPRAGG